MAYKKDDQKPQRMMFDVSKMGLKCASCGAAILELPFQPTPGRSVYCLKCIKTQRSATSAIE